MNLKSGNSHFPNTLHLKSLKINSQLLPSSRSGSTGKETFSIVRNGLVSRSTVPSLESYTLKTRILRLKMTICRSWQGLARYHKEWAWCLIIKRKESTMSWEGLVLMWEVRRTGRPRLSCKQSMSIRSISVSRTWRGTSQTPRLRDTNCRNKRKHWSTTMRVWSDINGQNIVQQQQLLFSIWLYFL